MRSLPSQPLVSEDGVPKLSVQLEDDRRGFSRTRSEAAYVPQIVEWLTALRVLICGCEETIVLPLLTSHRVSHNSLPQGSAKRAALGPSRQKCCAIIFHICAPNVGCGYAACPTDLQCCICFPRMKIKREPLVTVKFLCSISDSLL